MISGQFGSYGDGTSVSTAQRQMQGVYDQTGRWPALTGMDYRNWDMSHGNNLSDATRYLFEHWNSGGREHFWLGYQVWNNTRHMKQCDGQEA